MRTLLNSLLLVLAGLFLWTCAKDDIYVADDQNITFRAEDESGANYLSYPVIFSEGAQGAAAKVVAPGAIGDELWGGVPVTIDGEDVYLQKDPLNLWHASSYSPEEWVDVDLIDWGDNLEARSWKTNSIVRVEVVLEDGLSPDFRAAYHDNKAVSDREYQMVYYRGQGISEIWGTNCTKLTPTFATVYSANARLIIQRIEKAAPKSPLPGEGIYWDMDERKWKEVNFEEDGQLVYPPNEDLYVGDGYGAEVNVKGKVIYGYNWQARRGDYEAGVYRITFVFEDQNPYLGTSLNTGFNENTMIVPPSDSPNDGGYSEVKPEWNLTFIDVLLIERNSGNGGGGYGQGRGRKGNYN